MSTKSKSKLVTKVAKISGATFGMMAATMVVGAGLATAGWWFSDRLDVANLVGEPVEINEVKGGDCTPGTSGVIAYTTQSTTPGSDGTEDQTTQTIECQKGTEWDTSNALGFLYNRYAKTYSSTGNSSSNKLVTVTVKRKCEEEYENGTGECKKYKVDPKEKAWSGPRWVVTSNTTATEKAKQDAANALQKAKDAAELKKEDAAIKAAKAAADAKKAAQAKKDAQEKAKSTNRGR